jgi:hypothetical protein
MTTHSLDSMQELDSRTNDGIHVRLLWLRAIGDKWRTARGVFRRAIRI